MRLTLAEEFSAIHVYNLRGNQRTAGEQSRREGGKVFGGGSRATVSITVLVKKPRRSVKPAEATATVHYTDIGDYLTREEKLARITEAGGVTGLEPVALSPNAHGDWLNQRAEDFEGFMAISSKSGQGVFHLATSGLKTNRDVWNYNSSSAALRENVRRSISFYNEQVSVISEGGEPNRDPSSISWDRAPLADAKRGRKYNVKIDSIRPASYRPFYKSWVYPDRQWNNTVYQMPRVFPGRLPNLGIETTAPASHYAFCAIAAGDLPDFHLLDTGQFFPRWTWEPVDPEEGTLDLGDDASGETADGYRRVDNISDAALQRWQSAYGDNWVKDDVFFYVYGLLHSPDYRERYAADLKRMLPRIPLVSTTADARAFVAAGRTLGDLHISYEQVTPYPLEGLNAAPCEAGDEAAYDFYAVSNKKMRFGGKGKEKDRSVIHYNDRITLSGIPEEAYRYQLGSRSAIEWIIDRYWVKTDKASGIVNDPNDWSREVGDPRYIIDLLARVVTVSLETMRIVDSLPNLEIAEQQ